MDTGLWGRVSVTLKSNIGESNFDNWIKPLEFNGITEGVARFNVPTAFYGNYVNQNFGDQILYLIQRNGAAVERIAFDSAQSVQKTAAPRAKRMAQSNGGMQPELSLDPNYTFDNFVVGKPNEVAFAAARRLAEGGPVVFNPLFLHGGVGLGKTHLMHAIAHELLRKSPDLNVLYVSAEQFMYRFISAIKDRKMIDFKQMFRSVDVLMIDDVQFIAGKESTQEEFFHTFNAVIEAGKQIVISGDRAPGDIEDLENRIKSRLECGFVVDMHPTNFELRMGILESKMQLYKEQFPGIEIDKDVREFLAHKIVTSVRVLDGALKRLFAFSSLVGRPVTLEMVHDCLADLLKSADRKVTIDEIQRLVAEHYNIRLSDMIGPKRMRVYARPRQVAMWLAKEMTSRSLPEIGRKFGGRDHTTVMHGVRKINELESVDPQLSDDLALLKRALTS